ncbi:MAG: hypothetical protein JST08_14400 [Actinobacteria bacterium]|nr:hypothetical protein [Actinomycetota bacterium]
MAAAAVVVLTLLVTSGAGAATPKARIGHLCAAVGSGGGQCGSGVGGTAVNVTGAGGVAVGSVYLLDAINRRVEQFSASGGFIRAFGKGVNLTTGGDVCTLTSGDVCTAGVADESAGAMNGPWGIAIDQSTGAVYLSEQNNRRIDVFSATGSFEGAIGWGVDASSPAEELQFCTAATGCLAGVAGPAAGQLENLKLSGLAVDPRDGDLYVADFGNLRIAEYAISTNGSGEVVGAGFVRALGWNVDLAAPAEELQDCTLITGCKAGTSGGGKGQFSKEGTSGTPGTIAVDSAGSIYAVTGKGGGSCSVSAPCRIQKFNPDGTFKEDFGPSSGECQLTYTAGTAIEEVAFDVAVDPVAADGDNHVFVARKVGPTEYRVYELDEDGGECVVSPSGAPLVGIASVLRHGLAVGLDGRVYAGNATAEASILGEAPPAEAEMTEVAAVNGGGATFAGRVTPPPAVEGQAIPTTWHFEYSADQSHWTAVPAPPGSVSSAPGVAESVEESVAGLGPGTDYFVRLCATTSPTVCSNVLEFTTKVVGPTVAPYSAEVTQSGATLGAEINPNNRATRYRIDWATQAEWALSPGVYAHHLPAQDRAIGAGFAPVDVREQLSDLAPAAIYHFRVSATSSAGTTVSADQRVETLNSCGMTDGRCLELVSRTDKGPLANPGRGAIGGVSLQFQAAAQGSGLAYTVDGGYPDAVAGDESVYLAQRGESGWSSVELSPPASEPPVLVVSGLSGGVKVLSADLTCSVVSSSVLLTPDSSRAMRDAGGTNLYRRDSATGAYRLMTTGAPTGLTRPGEEVRHSALGASEYQVIGVSPDCERIVFRTRYRFAGIPSVAATGQLYEWDRGTLRNVAMIPGPSGESEPVPAESIPGAIGEFAGENPQVPLGEERTTDFWRAVSGDVSRTVFTAVSRFGGDSGNLAVFLSDAGDPGVRSGARPAIDVSQSEAATPNDGYSRYQAASVDGRRVFFTARYGLAGNGSSSGATACDDKPWASTGQGCDLYEYDLEGPAGGKLTDLSPDTADAGGAEVAGVLAVSDDGAYVYFAARGKIGGEGLTGAANRGAGSYNVYLAHGGSVSFVHSIGAAEVLGTKAVGQALVQNGAFSRWSSRTSPGGGLFAFESSLGVPGGARMVYLYSAHTGITVCVSCRHDGLAPYSVGLATALPTSSDLNEEDGVWQPVALTENGRLFFYSLDPLATGAVEGTRNLFQWEHGQVSLIATEPPETRVAGDDPTLRTAGFFAGADADGQNVYFATIARLLPRDPDGRWDVYDARVGGGFAEPAPPWAPCDATAEGSCNPGGGSATAPLPADTATFTGPGDPVTKKPGPRRGQKGKHPKRQAKKHGRKGRAKKHRKAGKDRRANGDRGVNR